MSRSETRMIVKMNSLAAKDQSEQQDRERANLDARFPFRQQTAKIVNERIWINPVTNKIVIQPLEPYTDAQLHQELLISVRKEAEICLSSSTRENVPDEMRTSWKLSDVTKFQEEIKIAQKTAATPHVP